MKKWINRLLFNIKRAFYPQVTVVRKSGFNWVVATRRNAFTKKWVIRETLKNKKAGPAVKSAIAKYPGHFLYIPKHAIEKFKKSK